METPESRTRGVFHVRAVLVGTRTEQWTKDLSNMLFPAGQYMRVRMMVEPSRRRTAWFCVGVMILGRVLSLLWSAPPAGKLITGCGLLLDGMGAVLALIPDISNLSKRFEPVEKIERIQRAQDELFLNGRIQKEDKCEGYEELASVLASAANMDEQAPNRISALPIANMPGGADVRFSGVSEPLGSVGLMDSRVSQHVESLRSKGHDRAFSMGLSLLATGFFLQLYSLIAGTLLW